MKGINTVVCSGALIAGVAAANPVYIAPSGGVDTDFNFLSGIAGINSELEQGFEDLRSGYSDLDNVAEVSLVGATSSLVIIAQEGNGANSQNKARVVQTGHNNVALVGQSGTGNAALIEQVGNRNRAAIGQIGGNSEAVIAQYGNGNIAGIGQVNQTGDVNQLSINQVGSGNVAYIVGEGAVSMGINQNGGDFAVVNASQSMSVTINQTN